MFGMRGHEHLRCEHDLLPLAGIDGLHGAGETTCATGAYFDNHQHCAVTHHQIEFTATETDIACDQLQSATLEQAQRRVLGVGAVHGVSGRSEEHTSELQSLMRISYAVFCLKKKTK